MINHRSARKNMVDCQLNTSGITDPRSLQLFGALPREIFIADAYRDRAYVDEDLVMADGRVLMEPVVHARMIQALEPKENEVALMVGDTTGYAAAVMCGFVSTVITVETRAGALDQARQVWAEIGANNIAVVAGSEHLGCADHAPYNLIVLHGAVAYVPEALLGQLAPGGRLVTVLRPTESEQGRITVIARDTGDNLSAVTMQDAATPYIPALAPPALFKFG